MSEQLVARIEQLDDFQLVRFFKWFGTQISDSLDCDRSALADELAADTRSNSAFSSILKLENSQASKPLSEADAVIVARNTLEAMAHQPNCEKALCAALDSYSDDEMPASIILALGFAASMIIVAATTKFRIVYKDGKVSAEVEKESAPQALQPAMKALETAAGVFKPASR